MSVNNLLIKLKQEGYIVETEPNEEIEGTNKLIITKGEDSYYEELCKGLLDGSLTKFKAPEGLTTLASYRFYQFQNLEEVDLTGITRIGYYAFNSVYTIKKLTLDPNTTSISNFAFNALTHVEKFGKVVLNLTDIGFGENFFSSFGLYRPNLENDIFEFDLRGSKCRTTSWNFFRHVKYINIQLPDTYTNIALTAFSDIDHCNIYYNSTTPPTLSSSAYQNATNYKNFVPYNSINAYKTASNWTEIANSIYGFVNENTLEAGYVLPTTNDEGLSLKWYSDIDMTNAVTAVEDTTIKYYCKVVYNENIIQDGTNLTITSTSAEITQDGTNLMIGG